MKKRKTLTKKGYAVTRRQKTNEIVKEIDRYFEFFGNAWLPFKYSSIKLCGYNKIGYKKTVRQIDKYGGNDEIEQKLRKCQWQEENKEMKFEYATDASSGKLLVLYVNTLRVLLTAHLNILKKIYLQVASFI